MINYAKSLPRDRNNSEMQGYPAPFVALQRFVATTLTSSVVTLTDNTTAIEVGTVGGGGVLMRWIPATETATVSPFGSVLTTNYDHFIPANSFRRFVVPIETMPSQSVVGANIANGLYRRVAWLAATAPPSSVLASEF